MTPSRVDQRGRGGDRVGRAERPLLDGDLHPLVQHAGGGAVSADDDDDPARPRVACGGERPREQRPSAEVVRGFGVAERIRVPRPAARISTVEEGTG